MLEPRLLALFLNACVSEATLNKIGPFIKTIALLTSVADTEEAFRTFLEMETVVGKPSDLATTMEQAAIMSVHKAASSAVDVEVEAQAKRRLENKTPQLKMGELDCMSKIYAATPMPYPSLVSWRHPRPMWNVTNLVGIIDLDS